MFIEDKGDKTDKYEPTVQAASNFTTHRWKLLQSLWINFQTLSYVSKQILMFVFLKKILVKLWDVLSDTL